MSYNGWYAIKPNQSYIITPVYLCGVHMQIVILGSGVQGSVSNYVCVRMYNKLSWGAVV